MIFRSPFLWVLLSAFLLASACASSDSSSHRKSFWESFTDFFSPSEKPEGDGELYRELADLDKEIHETEWKYSRENRPQKKSRYKAHLSKLRVSRDSLSEVIERTASGTVESPSASSSSSAEKTTGEISVSSMAVSSSSEASSSVRSELLPRVDSVVVTTTVMRFVRDTVYIRDTVFVRDSTCAGESSPGSDGR